jgi:protein-L-isoaspartate(D-aspartate) O-methyltransferase
MISALNQRIAKITARNRSMRPFRRFLSSVAALGAVSLNSAGCAQADNAGCKVEPGAEREEDRAFTKENLSLVESIREKGVKNERVLKAIAGVPRHRFVDESLKQNSYEDNPLPIGQGQTISQPFIVAYMTDALDLQGDERVLEIGTGSGYQAAVLSKLARTVYSVEIIPELASKAKAALTACGIANVHQKVGDGYQGWRDQAPFDAIIVTAAPPAIPENLVEQLRTGGTLVLPVGENGEVQWLLRLKKNADGSVSKQTLIPVRFVPMVPQTSDRK